MILIRVPFLWVSGLAFFPFVFTKYKKPNQVFINHEKIHLRQQLELGLLFFYLWYLVEYLFYFVEHKNHKKAYYQIRFEREAYQNECNMAYLKERKFWAFLETG
jgi:hypothetical protein